jgi:hypothetical protein
MYAALTGLLAVLPDLPAVVLLLVLVPLGVVVHVAALWVVSRRELDYLRTQAGDFAGALSGRRARKAPEAGA